MRTKHFLYLLGVILFVGCSHYFINAVREASENNRKTLAEIAESSYVLPGEDSTIFKTSALKDILVRRVLNSKVRNSFILASYRDFYIIVHKYFVDNEFSLDDINYSRDLLTGITTGISYRADHLENFDIQIQSGFVDPLEALHLTVSCNSLQKYVINDSVIKFKSSCGKFAMRFSDDSPVNLFIEKSNLMKEWISILFWKRMNYLYTFFIFSKNGDREFDKRDIQELLNL